MADEIISVEDIVKTPRGRKAELSDELIKTLKSVNAKQAVSLSSTFGSVAKEKRGTVSGKIRRHFAAAQPGKNCRVNYTPEGIPQVSLAQ